MSAAASVLRRALLYVPSSSSKMLSKSTALAVDTLCYDLEDSVTPGQKTSARTALAAFLSSSSSSSQPRPHHPHNSPEISVRINDISSGLALADLEAVLRAAPHHLDTIVVPKVNSAADLLFVSDVLRHILPERHPSSPSAASPPPTRPDPHQHQDATKSSPGTETEIEPPPRKGPIKLLALVESATAILSLPQICAASPPNLLDGLIFAAEDFALDLSLTRTPSLSEFLYARSAIAVAARAFNLSSTLDLVCTSYQGDSGLKTLEEECENGRGMGFNGKQCIHPGQVGVVQRAFAPGDKEVEWAVRVCVADGKAAERGRGAWTLDGRMIDAPVVRKARGVVRRAERCGIDVGVIREKWKDQEPE